MLAVYVLIERGDLRGELIVLQLQRRIADATVLKRLDKLLIEETRDAGCSLTCSATSCSSLDMVRA